MFNGNLSLGDFSMYTQQNLESASHLYNVLVHCKDTLFYGVIDNMHQYFLLQVYVVKCRNE